MEAKLKTDAIEFLGKVLDTSITHEETAEIIVPDAMPDIAEVVCVEGNVTLRSKEADMGRVTLSGTVGATVVYLPEGERCLKKLDLSIPFTTGCDAPEVTEETKISIVAKIGSIDGRMINSRKALVRVDLLVECLGYASASIQCTSGMDDGGEAGLMVRQEKTELSYVSQVREKTFVLSDEFNMPAGKPPIGELVKTRVRLASDDVKSVGNKLIFKGAACIDVMYTAQGSMEPETARFNATFSQIMELDGESPGASYDIQMMLTNVYIENGGSLTGESEAIAVEMHIVAQAIERKTQSVEYISDVYSTRFNLEDQKTELTMESEDGCLTIMGEVRESIELPIPVARVVDTSVTVGKVMSSQEGGKLHLRTAVCLSAVYLNEQGEICGLNRRFESKAEMDIKPHMSYTASADVLEEITAEVEPGGIGVKIPVQFTVRPCCKLRLPAVTGASWDEENPKDLAEMPSVVVYHAVGGENLWHLAKRYSSTEQLIVQANSLEESAVPYPGQMFIIPKTR